MEFNDFRWGSTDFHRPPSRPCLGSVENGAFRGSVENGAFWGSVESESDPGSGIGNGIGIRFRGRSGGKLLGNRAGIALKMQNFSKS